jgi:hypothetical protein
MPTAQTRIPTDRGGRYLAQLCHHLEQLRGHTRHDGGPPQIRHVEWTDDHGVVDFPSGRCTLRATADTLTVSLTADDSNQLQQLQELLSARLNTIGRRDTLVVTW